MPESDLTGPPSVPQLAKSPDLMQALSVLALIRTTFSSERSVLSWMRTSVSLYAFGFSIAKFTHFLERHDQGMSTGLNRLGLALIIMGIVGLAFSLIEHARRVRRMRSLGLPETSPSVLPTAAAGALLTIGIVTMVGIAIGM